MALIYLTNNKRYSGPISGNTNISGIPSRISNSLTISNSTPSTSTVTGALVVTGGVGISGALNVSSSNVDKIYVDSAEINNLNISGDFKTNSISSLTDDKLALGSINSISITGGSNQQILVTDGDGNLSWQTFVDQIKIGQGLEKVGGYIKLKSTGVSPGTYSIVTVDAQGRVVTGSNESSFDDLEMVTRRGATTDQVISITNTNDSGDVNQGALVVSGGVGVGQQLTANTIVTVESAEIGANLTVVGQSKFAKTVEFSSAEFGLPPILLKSGRLVDNPESGSLEFDGAGLYISTDLGRKQLQLAPEPDSISTVFAVRVVARTNIDLSNPQQNQVLDDVYYDYWDSTELSTNDRVLLVNQTNPVENGIYVWRGAGIALVRSQDFNAVSRIRSGSMVKVVEGLQNVGCVWSITTIGYIFADVTPIIFTEIISKDVMALASLVDDKPGLVTRTGRGSIELRTISSDSNFVQVVNDDGVEGNIVIKTGIVPVSSGGTGRSKFFGYLRGVGNAITSGNTIPSTSITGLGTLAKQNANAVAITGGVIEVQTLAVSDNLYTNTLIGGNANITNATVTNLRLINKPYQVFSFSYSNEWVIQHDRDTDKMQVSLFDSEGEQFFAKIKILDLNSFSVRLTESTSGVAIVYFMTDNIAYSPTGIAPLITNDGKQVITETGLDIVLG